MRKADFLDEFQLGVLRERGYRFGYSEHGADDIMRRVSQLPGQSVSRRDEDKQHNIP